VRKTSLITEFTIPALPPSLNRSHKVNFRSKRVYLDQSARDFKMVSSCHIPAVELSSEDRLRICVEYHGKFLNKDGTTKRKDGQNLDKILYDSIFTVLGQDDKIVWEGTWKKVHSDDAFTKVKIYKL
jgi:Holliday junction resolvase RusA-like endonuclease